jgi:anti-sigma factor RsiW
VKDRHTHISTERMQALLDGDLSAREASFVRGELDRCPRCHAEFEAWEALFQDLGDLPVLTPSVEFRERVMAELPARSHQRLLAGLFGRRDAREHASPEELQEHLDGRLAARASARLEEHLSRCATCRTEVEGLHSVVTSLEALPVLEPSPGFSEAVMASLSIQRMAEAAMAPTTRRERALAWVRSHMPASGRGWAAALGMGTAPAVVVALAVQAVFSHELVTLGNLLSFLTFKLSGILDGVSGMLAGLVAENALLGQVWAVAQTVGASPALTAATAAALSGTCLGAVWILYRNFVFPSGKEGRYAQASR